MSWSIELTSNIPITKDIATAIVAELPLELRGPLHGPHENTWGWTTAVDIHLPEPTHWRISGAGYSRPLAEPTARFLAEQLQQRGYRIQVGARRD